MALQLGNYVSSVPALPTVANEVGAGLLVASRAEAVVAGTPRKWEDLYDAIDEEQARKRHRKLYPANVTKDEVVQSTFRKQTLEQEIAPAAGFVAAVAPPWAVSMQNHLNNMQNQLNNIQIQLATLLASSQNRVARKKNAFVLGNDDASGNAALMPLQKAVTGCGRDRALAVRTATTGLPPALLEVPPVGAVPQTLADQGCFPGNVGELERLTHSQVLALIQYYNNDFLIVQGDDIVSRRMKFKDFLK
eukprot:CAMPEP_0196652010 /NCGR_PEP_ID=MMETSP1086-20130531/1214_1 /TAXON_ID=77921 /ORGANISM="Cyanoptyche  gloeocystis , Strain SAG4.97" /LENGTH=247 /DNA_ID=CAMNT_0041982341 /DNA_START=110 /DNA_END=853 /DNA_ORIENTATION=+